MSFTEEGYEIHVFYERDRKGVYGPFSLEEAKQRLHRYWPSRPGVVAVQVFHHGVSGLVDVVWVDGRELRNSFTWPEPGPFVPPRRSRPSGLTELAERL